MAEGRSVRKVGMLPLDDLILMAERRGISVGENPTREGVLEAISLEEGKQGLGGNFRPVSIPDAEESVAVLPSGLRVFNRKRALKNVVQYLDRNFDLDRPRGFADAVVWLEGRFGKRSTEIKFRSDVMQELFDRTADRVKGRSISIEALKNEAPAMMRAWSNRLEWLFDHSDPEGAEDLRRRAKVAWRQDNPWAVNQYARAAGSSENVRDSFVRSAEKALGLPVDIEDVEDVDAASSPKKRDITTIRDMREDLRKREGFIPEEMMEVEGKARKAGIPQGGERQTGVEVVKFRGPPLGELDDLNRAIADEAASPMPLERGKALLLQRLARESEAKGVPAPGLRRGIGTGEANIRALRELAGGAKVASGSRIGKALELLLRAMR